MWSLIASIFQSVLSIWIEEAKKPTNADVVHSDEEEQSWGEEANELWEE